MQWSERVLDTPLVLLKKTYKYEKYEMQIRDTQFQFDTK